MPDDVVKALKPELTSPVIVFLCHPSCKDTGKLFEVREQKSRKQHACRQANDSTLTGFHVLRSWAADGSASCVSSARTALDSPRIRLSLRQNSWRSSGEM